MILTIPLHSPAWALDDPPAMTSTWDATVRPLQATISAALYAPLPMGTTFILETQDDSPLDRRIHTTIEQALATLKGVANANTGHTTGPKTTVATTPLDMSYSLYVIPTGTPPKAARVMGSLEAVPIYMTRGISATRLAGARWGIPEGRPLGVNVTDLEGRGAPMGRVFSQDHRVAGAVLRLELMVRDQRTGQPLWSGWADVTTRGLKRDQVVALVADDVLATLGQTVAGRQITIPVPPEMGGAGSQ